MLLPDWLNPLEKGTREITVAKKQDKLEQTDKASKAKDEKKPDLQSNAWISFRSGAIIIGVLSVGMAVLTTIQAMEVKPLGEAILYGLLFGASLWVVFFGLILINRLLGRH